MTDSPIDKRKGGKGKRGSRRAVAGHRSVPGTCEGYHDDSGNPWTVPTNAVGKSAAEMAAYADSPRTRVPNPPRSPGAAQMAQVTSSDRGSGYPSADAYNTGRGGTSSNVAWNHPDLRQSNVNFKDVLANLRTVRGNVVDAGIPDSSPGGFSHPGQVALASFDAANQAGSYRGMQSVNHNPARPDYHQERGSATAPNGSHSLSDPASHVRKSRVDIMREALFGE